MKASDFLVQQLSVSGVGHWFYVPGELNEAVCAAMIRNDASRTMCRDERNAMFMADGYYRRTGKMAVVCTAGGGATFNAMAGLSVTMSESTPLLLLAIEPPHKARVIEAAWHEILADSTSPGGLGHVLTGLVRCHANPSAVEQIPATLGRLVTAATSGRGGPVALEMPSDLLDQDLDADLKSHPPVSVLPSAPSQASLDTVLSLLTNKKVAILAGRGVLAADCCELLASFADELAIPVISTFAGRACIVDSHACSMGTVGFTPRAKTVYEEGIDVLLVIGASGWEWDRPTAVSPNQATVHIDVDPVVFGRFAKTIGLQSDAKEFLRAVLGQATGDNRSAELTSAVAGRREWLKALATKPGWPFVDPTALDPAEGPLLYQRAIHELVGWLPSDVPFWIDIGEFCWAAFAATVREPGTVTVPIRSSHMGWGIPAAIGASRDGDPTTRVVLCGDGGLLTTGTELATAAELGAPLLVLVLNNGGYNIIRKHFEVCNPDVAEHADAEFMFERIDVESFAKSLGCDAVRAEATGDVARILSKLSLPLTKPLVIDARVEARSEVEATFVKGWLASRREKLGHGDS